MKPFILFACIILSFGAFSQSNVYKPFPLVEGASWKVRWQDHDCVIPPNYGDAKWEYTLLYDTLINTTTYKILQVGPSISGIPGCDRIWNKFKHNPGAIRQDTAAKMVYYYQFHDSTEYLLFDYTLQVGDTIDGYLNISPYNYNLIVLSIDSVLIGNQYHKSINFDYNHSIIEGVGSDAGLLENLWYFEAASSLICFSIDSVNYLGYTNDCGLDLSPVNESPANTGISIYPNPAATEFTVRVDNTQKLTVQLYNLTGQKQCSYHVIGNQIAIPRENWPNGVYIVHILMDNDVLIVKKLVFAD